VKVFGSRIDVTLREFDVPKELQSASVARLGFHYLGSLICGSIQVPGTEINQCQVDTRILIRRVGGDRVFKQVRSLFRIILLRVDKIAHAPQSERKHLMIFGLRAVKVSSELKGLRRAVMLVQRIGNLLSCGTPS
jgi:hypothetical protein